MSSPLKQQVIRLCATALGPGYIPVAPGTFGSLWGVLIFYLLRDAPRICLVVTALLVMLLAIMISHLAEKAFGKKDAQQIVIDEVAGQLCCYALSPYSLLNLMIGFVLFRFFDVVKIFPARLCQDRLPGGLGVVMDDVVAGLQAGTVLIAGNYFLNVTVQPIENSAVSIMFFTFTRCLFFC